MERDVEVLDAEREVDRVDVLERARQGAQVCDEKHQAGKRDEQAKSRCHEVARPPSRRWNAKADAGARLR